MRRHMTMDELAADVLSQAAAAAQAQTKTASAPDLKVVSEVARDMLKLATEIRTAQLHSLTYDDVAKEAEARLGKR